MYELQNIEKERIATKKKRIKKINWYENKVMVYDKRIHELQRLMNKANEEKKTKLKKLVKSLSMNYDDASNNLFDTK